MLVQGPKQPGTDLNLYLQLLKEELETLWKDGANTWDAVAQEYFPMKAAVITTVQDYPGYGYFLGQVVQGFYACVRCKDNTMYRQLGKDPGSLKSVFQGSRGGFPRNTRGENLDICSMGASSEEHPQLEGAAKKSTTC